MKVLLVEPDRVLAQTARAALSEAGHSVSVVSSGQRAVDALDSDGYDLVVLEPQLGLHNGIELLYELRSYAEWRELPVVLWTLNKQLSLPVYEKPLRQLGISKVLYKPTDSLATLLCHVSMAIPA
jgi:DNA-binding response OmpR family regulator